ncbi:hypothetical protein vseg_004522 [Gypsophila vaccaria]
MSQFTVYLLSTFLVLSTFANAANLVPETCTKISKLDTNIKYDFCVTSLGSDLKSSKATLKELADISFKLDTSKAKSFILTVQKLIKDPKFDTYAKQALHDCLELYSDGLDDLEAGHKAMVANDYGTANSQVSAALDSGYTCEEGFTEKIGDGSPLTRDNAEYEQLVAISLGFVELLK